MSNAKSWPADDVCGNLRLVKTDTCCILAFTHCIPVPFHGHVINKLAVEKNENTVYLPNLVPQSTDETGHIRLFRVKVRVCEVGGEGATVASCVAQLVSGPGTRAATANCGKYLKARLVNFQLVNYRNIFFLFVIDDRQIIQCQVFYKRGLELL